MKHKWVLLIKKNTGGSIKDGLIITDTVTGILFALKATKIRPPNTSLYTMDIIKPADGMRVGILVEDYAVYKKWIKVWTIALRLGMNINITCSTARAPKYYSSLIGLKLIIIHPNTWHIRSLSLLSTVFPHWRQVPLFLLPYHCHEECCHYSNRYLPVTQILTLKFLPM